jgi:hypothetical protein
MLVPDWHEWSWAILRGFPRPEDGPRHAALIASILRDGVQQPLLIDCLGRIWDGRSRHGACLELGIEPPFLIVQDGPAAARTALIQRQFTVLERADWLAHIRKEFRENFSHLPGDRESEKFSVWLQEEFGWETGYSWKNLDGYQRLAHASVAERRLIHAAKPENLHRAMQLIRPQRAAPAPRSEVDGPEQMLVIETGSAFLNAIDACPVISETVAAVLQHAQQTMKRRLRTP